MISHSDAELTFEDTVLAIKHAELRRYEALYAGLKDKFFGNHLSEMEVFKREAAAVSAEIAVAKWLGMKLALRINIFHNEPDLGTDIEVRCILKPNNDLVIRKNDIGTRRFVLVYVSRFKAKLIGWLHGYEGMESDYILNPNGKGEAWFIPQGRLYGMDTFEKGVI